MDIISTFELSTIISELPNYVQEILNLFLFS
jgi:hypothetical protein